MAKKVCIVSYHSSPNYGAALQLFATYKIIEQLGYRPVILNYQNEYEASQNSFWYLFKRKYYKRIFRNIIAGYIFKSIKNGKKNFKNFYGQMNYTIPIKTVSDILHIDNIDIFCVGSDQVWNPYITGGYDDVFFLNILMKQPKISYSSSLGSESYELDSTYLKNALKDFAAISVREKFAAKKIQSILKEKKIYTTVDPTFLFKQNEWKQLLRLSDNRLIKEQYVLIYAIGGEFTYVFDVAKKIAAFKNLKIACITLSNRKKPIDFIINDATPAQFVQLVRQADFVVTNSFHGTCFSIINNIPFVSCYYKANPDRSRNLLYDCRLQNRFYRYENSIDLKWFDNTDIKYAHGLLDNMIDESKKWLKGVLDGNIC